MWSQQGATLPPARAQAATRAHHERAGRVRRGAREAGVQRPEQVGRPSVGEQVLFGPAFWQDVGAVGITVHMPAADGRSDEIDMDALPWRGGCAKGGRCILDRETV